MKTIILLIGVFTLGSASAAPVTIQGHQVLSVESDGVRVAVEHGSQFVRMERLTAEERAAIKHVAPTPASPVAAPTEREKFLAETQQMLVDASRRRTEAAARRKEWEVSPEGQSALAAEHDAQATADRLKIEEQQRQSVPAYQPPPVIIQYVEPTASVHHDDSLIQRQAEATEALVDELEQMRQLQQIRAAQCLFPNGFAIYDNRAVDQRRRDAAAMRASAR